MSQLARARGLAPSTTHRLLAELVEHGFVEVDPDTRRYSLGLRVFELSQRVAAARGLAPARRVMDLLAHLTRESVLLGILDDTEMIYLAHVEGPGNPRVKGPVGARGPVHCTSMGKILLAFRPREEWDDLVGRLTLWPYTAQTITSTEALLRELATVRERGYALVDEEHEPGIRAVSVPVLQPGTATGTAVLSLAAPTFRVSMDQLREWVPQLSESAHEIEVLCPQLGGAR